MGGFSFTIYLVMNACPFIAKVIAFFLTFSHKQSMHAFYNFVYKVAASIYTLSY